MSGNAPHAGKTTAYVDGDERVVNVPIPTEHGAIVWLKFSFASVKGWAAMLLADETLRETSGKGLESLGIKKQSIVVQPTIVLPPGVGRRPS